MASSSVIMLPGAWETGEISMSLARAVAGLTGSTPFDVNHRMHASGFAAQGVDETLAQQCVEAIEENGGQARVVDDPGIGWLHPDILFVTRVSIASDLIQYDLSGQLKDLPEENLVFIQVGCVQQSRSDAGVKGKGAIVQLEGGARTRQLRIDLYLSSPRVAVSMNLGRTKYAFPELGQDWDFDRRARVLSVLSSWGRRVPVFPSPELLDTPLEDDAWSRAEFPNEPAMKHKASWYCQLGEHGLLQVGARGAPSPARKQPAPLSPPAEPPADDEEEDLAAMLALLEPGPAPPPPDFRSDEDAVALEALQDLLRSGPSEEPARSPPRQRAPAREQPPAKPAVRPPKKPEEPEDAFSRHLQSARSWIKRDMLRRALKSANLALMLRPESIEGLELRAKIHDALGNSDMAVKDHMQARAFRRDRRR